MKTLLKTILMTLMLFIAPSMSLAAVASTDTTTVPPVVVNTTTTPDCPDGLYPASYAPDAPCIPNDPCLTHDGVLHRDGFQYGRGDANDTSGYSLWHILECFVAVPNQTTPAPVKELPVTGADENILILLFGVAAIVTGVAAVRISRRPEDSQ